VILAVGFPNPIGWVIDKVGGFVEGVATAGFELLIGGLTAWVVDAVLWVVGGVFSFFLDSTDPNVQADWFVTGDGPYATTAQLGAVLLVGFVLAGITQGVLAGDIGGMLRRMALDLPLSVLGMVGLVAVTQALIRITDEVSAGILSTFEADIRDFIAVVTSLSSLGGGHASAFVVFVLGLVTVLAGLILVAELVVRAALIYIVVALAPLVFATRLWPATRGAARRCLDLLAALILSKLVIAVALSVAAAAAVGSGAGGEVTSLPTPEVFAEDPEGSVTQAVGILLTAAAAFGVAAFSPLLVTRLLPLTEAAVVGQGLRSGPLRAGHQGLMVANTAQMMGARLNQVAAGRAGPGASGMGMGWGASGAGSAGGPVVAAGAAAAAVATVPVRSAQRSAVAAGQPAAGLSTARPAPSRGGSTSGRGGDDG
jgi:hypothetical protein